MKPHLAHQALHGASGHAKALSLELEADLAGSIDRAVLLPDPLDLFA